MENSEFDALKKLEYSPVFLLQVQTPSQLVIEKAKKVYRYQLEQAFQKPVSLIVIQANEMNLVAEKPAKLFSLWLKSLKRKLKV